MRNLVFCILLSIVFSTKAQSIFTRTYGAPGSFNEGKSVGLTADSGYVIFGSTGGWGAVNGDMVLIKTDTAGIQEWAKIYGSNNTEQGISMKICADKGYIMAGNTNNSSDGNYDIYLVKADSIGEIIWTKTISGSNWDFCTEVIETADSSIYVLLNSNNIETYENIISIYKLDANGAELWNRNYSIGSGNKANAIISYNNDTLLFCGKSFNALTNSDDAFITMINSNGDNLWTYFYGDQRKDWANSMAKNPGGFIGVSANKLMDEGNRRPYFFSIDKTGTIQFNELQTGPQDIEAYNIQYNSTFNTYNIAIDYNDETYVSSGVWHFNLPFVYVCSGVIDGLGNSNPGEIAVNHDGGFTEVGTAYFLTPGQSSIFLMKMGAFCEKSNNNLLSIENPSKDEVIIYPNPANDVAILNESISEIISITSITGQSVPVLFEQQNISTKHLNNGTYFLNYKNNSNEFKTIKLLIFHP
jgi:hypothetical protein